MNNAVKLPPKTGPLTSKSPLLSGCRNVLAREAAGDEERFLRVRRAEFGAVDGPHVSKGDGVGIVADVDACGIGFDLRVVSVRDGEAGEVTGVGETSDTGEQINVNHVIIERGPAEKCLVEKVRN